MTGYVSFLVGNSAQFIEDEDVKFRNGWIEERSCHELFLLKTGVWWLLSTIGEQPVPSGLTVTDQEALKSLMLRRVALPLEMRERAAALRRSLKKGALTLQRRFVMAYHSTFDYEAVVFSAEDFVDSEWKALMEGIEEAYSISNESKPVSQYRFRLSPPDATLGILAGLAARWDETTDIREAVYFDHRELPGGFVKQGESASESKWRADCVYRVLVRVDRVAKSIRDMRVNGGTASIFATPFVPREDGKSVKVLDLDSGKEMWLQLDEFRRFGDVAHRDYQDEQAKMRICDRETMLISGEGTYHHYVERDVAAFEDFITYSPYSIRRLTPEQVARWFLLSGSKVPDELRELVADEIYSPLPKEPPYLELLTQDAEPIAIDTSPPHAIELYESPEVVEDLDDDEGEDDSEPPPEMGRKAKNLGLMMDLLRKSDKPIKARALAKVAQPKIEVGTFRNHYKKDLERMGMKNDGDGYYLPKVPANTGT